MNFAFLHHPDTLRLCFALHHFFNYILSKNEIASQDGTRLNRDGGEVRSTLHFVRRAEQPLFREGLFFVGKWCRVCHSYSLGALRTHGSVRLSGSLFDEPATRLIRHHLATALHTTSGRVPTTSSEPIYTHPRKCHVASVGRKIAGT